jgi:protein-tyrosine phosphatase
MLDLQPVLAHVERYGRQFAKFQKQLLEGGVLFQCNADAFLGGLASVHWLRMLKNGEIHFLGSDCHNTDTRPPKLDQAEGVIKKKLGKDAVESLDFHVEKYPHIGENNFV